MGGGGRKMRPPRVEERGRCWRPVGPVGGEVHRPRDLNGGHPWEGRKSLPGDDNVEVGGRCPVQEVGGGCDGREGNIKP
jgi:hypothetical protein